MHPIPREFVSQILIDGFFNYPDKVFLPETVTIGSTVIDSSGKYKVSHIVEDWNHAYSYIVVANRIQGQPMWFHVDTLLLDGYEIDLNYVDTNDTDYVNLGDIIPGFKGYQISRIAKHSSDEGYTVYAESWSH